MRAVLELYILMIPVILAGASNMVFCKSSLFDRLKYPIDNGQKFLDGKPWFGANKTWKGFLGMIALTIFFQLVWAAILKIFPESDNLHLGYRHFANNLNVNLWLGFLLGFSYVLFELPNSFIKRRLNIQPGKLSKQPHLRIIFFCLDQIDSLIGCLLILNLWLPLTWQHYIGMIVFGMLTHVAVNRVLFKLKIRQNRN